MTRKKKPRRLRTPSLASLAKRKAFAKFFVAHYNAAQAVREIGLKVRNPRDAGWKLLQDPQTIEFIKTEAQRFADQVDVERAAIVAALKHRIELDPRRLISWHPGGYVREPKRRSRVYREPRVVLVDSARLELADAQCVESVEAFPNEHGTRVKITLTRRHDAIDMLARIKGLYKFGVDPPRGVWIERGIDEEIERQYRED